MQLEGASEPAALHGRRLEREQRPGIGGEIGFRYRDAASVHDRAVRAGLDMRSIRIEAPAEPGRHHVAVGVECDHRPRAEAMAHDEIGDARHAGGGDHGLRHRVRLDRKIEPFQQLPRARRVRRAIAGRIVARHLHQLGEEFGLPCEVAIDELAGSIGQAHDGPAARRSTASSMTRAATSASSAVMISRGEWLTPPLPQRTNSMARSQTPSNTMASWPAPLAR